MDTLCEDPELAADMVGLMGRELKSTRRKAEALEREFTDEVRSPRPGRGDLGGRALSTVVDLATSGGDAREPTRVVKFLPSTSEDPVACLTIGVTSISGPTYLVSWWKWRGECSRGRPLYGGWWAAGRVLEGRRV